ncbi:MAG: GNAT family N-acetyltransferase [bacterium]|nr:GNAT family N-acetyltransferase [bacterium]
MNKKLLTLLFLAFFSFTNEIHASSEDNFYYETYNNTLPTLFPEDPQERGITLIKITSNSFDYLETLESRLKKKSQVRPGFNRKKNYRLLKGNQDAEGDQGWVISIIEDEEEKDVGFISYAFYENDYPFPELGGKTCFEIQCYIEPDYQRQGISSAAFDSVLGYVRGEEKENIGSLLGIIHPSNLASKAFAESRGFSFLGEWRKFNQRKVEVWEYSLTEED